MENDYLYYNKTQFSFPRGFFNKNKLALIHKEISKLPSDSLILDAGCGSGLISKYLTNNYSVFGIDNNRNAVRFCTNNHEGNYSLATVENLPFKNNFFDGIIFSETIEHLPHPETAIKELKRTLKSDGILIITTPNYDSLKWKTVERLWYPVFGGACQPQQNNIHPSKFGKKELYNLIEKYFDLSEIKTFNFGMWLFARVTK